MAMSPQSKGIALCLLSTLLIVLQDSMSKKLLQEFSIAQIIFIRHIGFVLFAWWWAVRREGYFWRLFGNARRPTMQVLRSVLMVAEIYVFFIGLREIGVAQAHAIFMLFPIWTTLMASLFLREALSLRIFIALALGFLGALLIIRPGSAVFQAASLTIVLASVLFGLYHVVTRYAASRDGFRTSMAYMAVVGLLVSAPPGLWQWRPIVGGEMMLLMFLLTISGIIVHLLIVKSLEYASASVLQPYNYALVGWAALFGWLFYGERLDWLHYAGIGVILCGGLLMMGIIGRRRDTQTKSPPMSPR